MSLECNQIVGCNTQWIHSLMISAAECALKSGSLRCSLKSCVPISGSSFPFCFLAAMSWKAFLHYTHHYTVSPLKPTEHGPNSLKLWTKIKLTSFKWTALLPLSDRQWAIQNISNKKVYSFLWLYLSSCWNLIVGDKVWRSMPEKH